MSAKVFLLALLLVTIAICSTTVAAFDGDIEGLEGPSPFLHIGSKISEIGERYGVKRPNEKSLGKLSFPAPPPLTPSENLSLPIPKIKKNKKVQRKRLIKRLSKKLSKEQRKLLKRILKRIRNNRKIRRLNKKNKKVKNYKKKQTKKVKPLIKKFKKTLPKKQRKLLRKVIKRIKKAAQKKRSQKKRSQKKGSQKKGSQKKVAPGKKTTKCALPVGKRPDLSKCEKPVKPKVKKVAAKPKDKCPIPNVVIKGPLKCPSGRYMVVTRRRSCLRIDGRCHVIIRRECIRDKSKPVQKRVAVGPTRCDLGFELRQTRSCNETVCVFTRFCTAQNVILPPVQPVYNFTGPVKCPKGERLVFQRDDAKKSFTRFCVEDSGLLATQRCQITGDPHIRPFRGSATSRIFTYMGKGDFVLAESYDKSFIVHGRFRKWKGGSVLSGVAILINGIDKVSYTASRQAFYLNGVEWNPRRNTTYQLPNGGTIHIPLKADAFRVRSANGARVLVTYHIAGASEALPNANRGILNTEILAPLTFRWSRGLCTRTDFVRRKLIHAPGQASGIFRRIEQVETEKDNHDGQAWLNMAYRKKARAYCKKKFGDKTKAAYKNCMIDFRYSWNTYLGRRLAQFTKGFYTHANKFNKRWFVREKLSPIEVTRRLRRRIRYLKLMVGRYTKRVNRLSKSKNDKIARLTRRFKRQYLRTLRRIVREKQSKIRVYSRHFIIHLKKVLAEFEDEGKREEYRKKALDSLDVKISRAEQKVRQYVNKQLTFLDRRVRAKVKAAFAKDDKCTKIEKKLKFTVLVLRELKRQLKVLRTRAVSMFKMSGNDAQVLRRRAIARLQQRIVDKQLHVKEFKKKFLEQLEQKLEAITDADAQEKARQNALAELKKITNEKQQAIKRYTVASLHRIDRFYRRVLEETKKLQYAQ